MLAFTFNDFLFSLLTGSLFAFLWNVYYVQNDVITPPKIINDDLKIKKIPYIEENYSNIVKSLIVICFCLYNYYHVQKFNTSNILWDTFILSNFSLNYSFITILTLLFILISAKLTSSQNVRFSLEYLLFVTAIAFFGYAIMSSTNLLLTIFLLELVALLIFGKFVVSKILKKTNKVERFNKSNKPLNNFSYGLFNSLFFQYWANFVSSVFLFFSIISIHGICGTSNFFVMNYLFNNIHLNNYLPNVYCSILLIILSTGFFVKLALSPYQFFKIETYKGIPIFFVIVYTTLYLVTYIFFFLNLYVYLFPSLRIFTSDYTFIFMCISVLYLFSLLFDTKNFKAFLSYSTLITVVTIFIVILTI